MASSDWEEVKRLAADFRLAQLSSSIQKLSERNCVEIMSKLLQLKLLDVYFTTDGKEYITPQQLSREIHDELFLHGGRISLTDLVPILNVGIGAIEARAMDIARTEPDVHLVLGQLVDSTYLDRLAEEVNENLQQHGQINISDLTKQYDFPAEFLQEHLLARWGSIIQGQQDKTDSRLIFTEGFLARNKAKIRGVLTAVTKPTPVTTIVSAFNFPERLFFNFAEELIALGRLSASITGGRQASKATYIPTIHSKSQSEWIDSFFKQNGYLEYDALARLGISDAKTYLRKRFKDESLTFLNSCCVGQAIKSQVDSSVEEGLASGTWVDLAPLLPSVFSPEDVTELLQGALDSQKKDEKSSTGAIVLAETVILSDAYLQQLKKSFETRIGEKAKQLVDSGAYLQAQADSRNAGKTRTDGNEGKKDKKEERRKKAAEGKTGGGTQGRETKTKSTKKKYLKGKGDEWDGSDVEDSAPVSAKPTDLDFMSTMELERVLRQEMSLKDAPEEMIQQLAEMLHRPLTLALREEARLAFQALLASSTTGKRKSHGDLQEKIQGLVTSLNQAEKALKQFSAADLQQQLAKHDLKTLGAELVMELMTYAAQEGVSIETSKEYTVEARTKLIGHCNEEVKPALLALNKATGGSSIEEFLNLTEAALSACGVLLKKLDRKKEKAVTQGQRQSLLEQLNEAGDAALTLHVTALLLFHSVTSCVLHASGRFVPQILSFLKPHLPSDVCQVLENYQGLVIQQLVQAKDENKQDIQVQLDELLPKVKEIAVTFKKAKSDEN
nr:EOG090X0267 [Lepidurus arcticus]